MAHLLLALVLAAAQPLPVRYPLGTLHGFPTMSDAAGKVIANGELTQEVAGDRVVVHVRWEFADGRRAEERDEFRAGLTLAQERFSWVETKGSIERRRFEVDFSTGKATSSVRDQKGHVDRDEKQLDLPGGRSFTGYGAALAVTQLALGPGDKAEITFVAFTAKPRAVTLEARREGEAEIGVAGRFIACDRYTLHPKIPFPLDLVAGAQDAHLWLTHAAPPSLVRAEQNLVTKDDPQVVIDVTPRGAAHPAREARARRGQRSAPREPASQGSAGSSAANGRRPR